MKTILEHYSPNIFQRLRWRLRSMRSSAKSWAVQKALDFVVWCERGSNYLKHTRREVPKWFRGAGPNRWMADGTLELLAVLSHQGHSGGSINFALKFFETMAKLEPWGPLTGAEEEWGEPYEAGGSRQNKRCSHVFKDADGRAYDSCGRIFREPDGSCFTNIDSRVFIEFPYQPKREYVDVQR